MLQRLMTPSIFFILLLSITLFTSGVADANNSPNTVGPIPAQTVNMNTTKTMNLNTYFNDVDGDALTYTVTSSDTSKATVSVSSTTLTITPVAAGTTTITLTGTDPGGLSATHGFLLTVTDLNNTPTATGTISDQTTKVGATTVAVDVSNYFDDADGDTLTYTVTSSDTTIATVSLSGATVSVTGVALGNATITATATDPDGASGTQRFTVTVANNAPTTVGTIPTQALAPGGTAVTIDLSNYFSDPDGDTLTYTTTSGDATKVTISVSGTNITLTPVAGGVMTIIVRATDPGGLFAEQTISVIMAGTPVAVGTIPNQDLFVGGSVTINASSYFSDPSGETLTHTATSSDSAVATVSLSDPSVTVNSVGAGTATITITAIDPGGLTATQTFSVTVKANNTPILIETIPAQTAPLGGSAITVDVSSYFRDPDGQPLTYTATSPYTAVVTVSVSGSSVSITGKGLGMVPITVTATDPIGASATHTILVYVEQPPVVVRSVPDHSVPMGHTPSPLNMSSSFQDPSGGTLTYSASSSDTSVVTVSVSGSNATFSPITTGASTITFTATNAKNLSASFNFTLTVFALPTAVGTIPNQKMAIGVSPTRTIDVSSYFSDPSAGDTFTYSAATSNSSAATVSMSEDILSITVGTTAGTATVTVTTTNLHSATATQTFSVTALVNNAPTGGSIPNQSEQVNWYFGLNLNDYFSDPDGDTLTYSASSTNTAVANVYTTGNTLAIPASSTVGVATISVTATDPYGASASGSFQFLRGPQTNNNNSDDEADAVPGLSGAEQSLLGRLLTYDTIIFNELHNGSDDTNDWLELRNVSNVDIPIDNWQLTIQTGGDTAVISFPAGTAIPAGEVLLIANTKLTTAAVVVESFVLPQTDFALILRSPTAFGDLAGNYFQTKKERPETAPELTVDTAWERVEATTSGYRAEAWAKSTHRNGHGSPGYQPPALAGDLNHDGVLNILDLVLVASQFGTTGPSAADLNADNTVNIQDLVLVANALSNVAAAPSAGQSRAALVNTWLQLARQSESVGRVEQSETRHLPKGFSYDRGIQVLEQLVEALTPDTTALLANYPNPFNPETWIPYQLAKSADVTVSIYASDGNVVRTLALGYQEAGMYKNRNQAAYWDGKNELGETVASGLYFYTLTAGDFTATRRMLILK